MSIAIAALLVLIGHPPTPIPPPTPVEVIGKVREVQSGTGAKADAVLELEDKSEVVLHGRDEQENAELKRLAGVRIKAIGVKGDPLLPRGNHVRVARFEILDVGGNGGAPRIGRVASISIDGKPRLLFVDDEGRADFLPQGWAAKMTKHVGSRIWLVGSQTKTELNPSRFGILRPGPKADKDDPKTE